jgi:superfamily II DNA or RNA helicase
MKRRATSSGPSLDLFRQPHLGAARHSELVWPPLERFPLNLNDRSVKDKVLEDLLHSPSALVVTGYASLDRVIDFVAECSQTAQIRILFGQEPFESYRETFELARKSLSDEIRDYWLNRGVSVLLSGKVIQCIERLKNGTFIARYPIGGERLHAKIYCGEKAATLGSSNFTRAGLKNQLEANSRYLRKGDKTRYDETVNIAENYWALGRDYGAELIALLEQLLQLAPWREALARACAEMLEGDWATQYLRGDYLPHEASLWESQRLGIAQALTILDSHDSVLIADATGSGKTRMGIHLIGALQDQNQRRGRLRRGQALMVCPPVVKMSWDEEAMQGSINLQSFSHGSLSHTRSSLHALSMESLRRAQILCVDEGHNFLNFKSNRTQRLLRNMADHMLLFTATPINRGVTDLLHIADLLGADNLKPSTLKAFDKMLGVRNLNRTLTEQEIDLLRKEIGRFTVRRTKRMLNALIDRNPDQYRDKKGNRCRFPKHEPSTYKLNETKRDRKIAKQIRVLADELYAVTHFQKPVEMPEILRRQGVSEDRYLQGRLNSAKKLARYVIMASLRSSRVALVEHIAGTIEARATFLKDKFEKASPLPGVINRLPKLKGQIPENRLAIKLPGWLADSDEHCLACEHDLGIYGQILALTVSMSDRREQTKAAHLLRLLESHKLLLAFDSRPITLADIAQRIRRSDKKIEVLVATGDVSSDRSETLKAFALGSDQKNLIGLCSDSLAEGVNLQQASVLMHLDMPSVVRIAEQRVGRVDRMDSPHKRIEAWWPDDAPEFALSSDERFVERYETVDNLLGSNMPLPDSMQRNTSNRPVQASDLIKEYETAEVAWDGVQDAFNPIRNLIGDDSALIPVKTYEAYRKVTARVVSHVSLVKATSPWAFFCVRAGSFGSPRWIFLPNLHDQPIMDLEDICVQLRQQLGPDVEDIKELTQAAESCLQRFIKRLNHVERSLISNKKQRALNEMEIVIEVWLRKAASAKNQQHLDAYQSIVDMLQNRDLDRQPDWDEVASRWLDVIRPVWYERLTARGRRKPLLLKDIRRDLSALEEKLGTEVIRRFTSFPLLSPPDERIAACIVGVS